MNGLDVLTIQSVLTEIGVDPTRWPTVKHFTSWLGISPDNQKTGGKIIKRGTKPSANRAATALRVAARSLLHSDSALGAYCRRMRTKLGTAAAITATAHKLARIIYAMLKSKTPYKDPGADHLEAQVQRTQSQAVAAPGQRTGLRTDTRRRLSTACPDPVLADPDAPGRRGVVAFGVAQAWRAWHPQIRPATALQTARTATYALKLLFRWPQPVSSPLHRSMCFLAGRCPSNPHPTRQAAQDVEPWPTPAMPRCQTNLTTSPPTTNTPRLTCYLTHEPCFDGPHAAPPLTCITRESPASTPMASPIPIAFAR